MKVSETEMQLMRHELAHAVASLLSPACIRAYIKPDGDSGMVTSQDWRELPKHEDIVRTSVAGLLIIEMLNVEDDREFISMFPAEQVADAFAWCSANVLPRVQSVSDSELIAMIQTIRSEAGIEIKRESFDTASSLVH